VNLPSTPSLKAPRLSPNSPHLLKCLIEIEFD